MFVEHSASLPRPPPNFLDLCLLPGAVYPSLCSLSGTVRSSVHALLQLPALLGPCTPFAATAPGPVKRFSESGEISVRKGQGQKPLLNARDKRALRWYCLRNRQATTMDPMGSGVLIIATEHSLPLHKEMHIYEGTMMQRLMLEFWRDICCRQDNNLTFPRNSMSISAGQCQTSFCTSYNSVAS